MRREVIDGRSMSDFLERGFRFILSLSKFLMTVSTSRQKWYSPSPLSDPDGKKSMSSTLIDMMNCWCLVAEVRLFSMALLNLLRSAMIWLKPCRAPLYGLLNIFTQIIFGGWKANAPGFLLKS